MRSNLLLLLAGLMICVSDVLAADGLQRIKYNNSGLVVDLGVGLWAWPVPWDVDGDGDHDLIVVCPDKPYNGTYLFENVSGPREKLPVFKAAKRLGAGKHYTMPSYVDGGLRVLTAGFEHPDFVKSGIDASIKSPLPANIHKTQVGSENANWLRQNESRDGTWFFKDMAKLDSRNIASPTTVDWNGDGVPDFLGGAEDGFFYFLRNPRSK